MFLVALKQNHSSNKKKILVPTPPFLDFKSSDIFTHFKKNDTIRHLWWLFKEKIIHGLPEKNVSTEPGARAFQLLKNF